MLAADTPPREIWNTKCAQCHGIDGSGKTKIGKKLSLKDYTDSDVQTAMSDSVMFFALERGVTSSDGRRIKTSYADELTYKEIESMMFFIRGLVKK